MITKKDYIAPNIEMMAGAELLQMVAASTERGITGDKNTDIGWGGEDYGEHEASVHSCNLLWDEEDEDDDNVP